jgi:hypothetical protein
MEDAPSKLCLGEDYVRCSLRKTRLRKTSSLIVIPKPGLSARICFCASGVTADFSRDNAALRNDNFFGIFKLQLLRGLSGRGAIFTQARFKNPTQAELGRGTLWSLSSYCNPFTT